MSRRAGRGKILIVTRSRPGSPRVLASSLASMLREEGREVDVWHGHAFLGRLAPVHLRTGGEGAKLRATLVRWLFRVVDTWRWRRLRRYRLLVFSEFSPTAFHRDVHGIEALRLLCPKLAIVLHEVYYLGNAPSQLRRLKAEGHPGIERYDWHLSVTDVTEVRAEPQPPWSKIGLNMAATGLVPRPKTSPRALVDFVQPGFEEVRATQIRVLEQLGIPYVALTERMSIEAIRAIYQESMILFVQCPEAFGVPIAECLSAGAAIFTRDASWPMSWRLPPSEAGGEDRLGSCFVVYEDEQGLRTKLRDFWESYDTEKTPLDIHRQFVAAYPHLHRGDRPALHQFLERFEV